MEGAIPSQNAGSVACCNSPPYKRPVWPKNLSHRGNALPIFRGIVLSNFNLRTLKARFNGFLRFLDQLLQAMIEPATVGIIDRHLFSRSTEELMKRQISDFRLQVPQGNIHRSHTEDYNSTTAYPIRRRHI